MKTYRVQVLRSTVYEVEAEDYDSAIDAVCEGEGEEIDDYTLDMNAEEYTGESQ